MGIADQYQHPKPAAVDDRAAEELLGVQEQLVVPEAPRGSGDSVLAPPPPSTARHGRAGAPENPIVSYPSRVDPVESQPSTHEPMDTHVLQDGPDDDGKQMMSALILAGANVEQARTYTAAVGGRTDGPTFMEFFGRGATVREANRARRCLNIQGLHALDLRTYRPDGHAWDFNNIKHRKDARRLVRTLKPTWMIGYPPCTAFSSWNIGIKLKKMNPKDVASMLEEGTSHLALMVNIYREQLKLGRHLLHEHPASALSWKEDNILEHMSDPRVHKVTCDQCQFGLTTKGSKEGERLPAMKPTRFISSSIHMISQLDRRCDRSHTHQHLTGGRCAEAAFYPLPLIRAILKGIRATHVADKAKEEDRTSKAYLHAVGSSPTVASSAVKSEVPHCFVKRFKSGAKVQVDFEDANFKDRYIDEYTGDVLDQGLIKEAMVEELTYFCEKEVWMLEDLHDIKSISDDVFVQSR